MLTVEKALETILARARSLPAESVLLADALGRTLAEDIAADIDLPPFDNSAVDGYAVRAVDVAGATPEAPVTLGTLPDVVAGGATLEQVTPGMAVRIMTGAPVPSGADAVIMIEDTRAAGEGLVAILEATVSGMNVRCAGEDVGRGERVLSAGTLIRPAEVAMLATVGRPRVPVVRTARVAVFSTGDELVPIEEETLPPGKIRDSNGVALAAAAREAGAAIGSITHLPDDLEAVVEALRLAASPEGGVDVIVTAGGVSMGDRDYIKPALERIGTLELWKVSMKPGKPLAFGSIGDVLFFGLPGNPVSALVTFELFVRPALRKLMGRSDADLGRPAVRAELLAPIAHTPGRREYVRAITTMQEGRFMTRPTGAQGSGLLRSMTGANSLLIVPTEVESLAAGATVTVLMLW